MIQTESSRRRDDEINWRKRDEPPTNGASTTDNKTRHMGGRQIGRSKIIISKQLLVQKFKCFYYFVR